MVEADPYRMETKRREVKVTGEHDDQMLSMQEIYEKRAWFNRGTRHPLRAFYKTHIRNIWDDKSKVLSTTIREKHPTNNAFDIQKNVRAWLIDFKPFKRPYKETERRLLDEDYKIIMDNFFLQFYPNWKHMNEMDQVKAKKEIDSWLDTIKINKIQRLLGIINKISFRLLNWERELFYLKCYITKIRPVHVMRVCHHVDFDQDRRFRFLEKPLKMNRLLEFIYWDSDRDYLNLELDHRD